MSKQQEVLRLALDALMEATKIHASSCKCSVCRAVIVAQDALSERTAQQEPVSIKSVAQKAGINLPETYIPTMDDAIAAGDSVLMNEQAALLRECRAALDSLIAQKPTLAGLLCGSTTLGNLKAELGAYRPQGVFGTSPQPASKPLTDEQRIAEALRRHGLTLVKTAAGYDVLKLEQITAHGIKGDA